MITVYYFGKIKHDSLREMTDYYINASSRYTHVKRVSLKENKSSSEVGKKKKENETLVRCLNKEKGVKILLDVEGKDLSTEGFAALLGKHRDRGERIAFYVGNYYGVDREIKEMFDVSISLSRMTFNHEIALMLTAEQIYRGLNLLGGGKYHK